MWPVEVEKKMLELVKEKEHLWNPKHESYTKKHLRKTTFDEIATTLKEQFPHLKDVVDGDDVRVKFKNIKNYFLQQQKKYQKTPRGPFSPKSKWHLYDIASFLSDSAPDTETKLSWEMMEQCTNELNSSKHTTDPSTRQSKKKKLEEKEEEVLKNVNSYFKAKLERKSNNNYDYAESAGNLVTVTLKQLPFVEQCKLMKKVQDVLSEVCSEHLSSVQ
ncbi:uncharacterized protein LOC123518809 isoform X2 [Portunus trituberculatus]|uniref:uncharacterized protein LOC123518809 isoform X2 n=1 Tax=Portunus trituberculatus TaxID=210409 RepID=UPI001E1CB3CE|nr:uncharacterized protein LOC123518809 isoform X2 [Portunus trituberculatus]